MKICVNWLPLSLPSTVRVARRAEDVGLWGIGVGDSPRYAELYSACATALEATSSLRVTTCVTNPVTRHRSVHISAARGLSDAYSGRFRLGVGRGDSAVHTFGLRHATLSELGAFLEQVRAETDTPLLLAASGEQTARLGGRCADGIIAGVGRRIENIADMERAAMQDRAGHLATPEIWATIRVAVAANEEEADSLRERLIPRAISASHFAFSSTFQNKGIPEEYAAVFRERYARYDYRSHGSSGATSNAAMFADRPDIEQYLVDRFAIVGTREHVSRELGLLEGRVEGVFCSLLFEDAIEQIDRIGDAVSL